MSLPFLRPMALPRPSTITRFLSLSRPLSTTPSPSPKTPLPPISTPIQTSTSTPNAPSPTDPEPAFLKPATYRITRTHTNGLPVYLLSKRGGNLKQTKLRRIEGNIMDLRRDLQKALGVEDEKEVVVNQLTQQIIVKVCVSPMVWWRP